MTMLVSPWLWFRYRSGMAEAHDALARLVEAATDGRLDGLCERHRVRIMCAFGSAAQPGIADLRDLDLAVAFEAGDGDILALWNDLYELCGPVELDLLDLDRARPVARANGLVGVPLYERRPGELAREQTAAMLERMDTAWLRRLDLELLAS
jgi:Polymerase beta, Nucleotidyltransferase